MSKPKFEVDEPVIVVNKGQRLPGVVLGIQLGVLVHQFVEHIWFYIVGLDDPIETNDGLQKALYVSESVVEESSDDSEPNIIETEWAVMGSYVYTCTPEQIAEGHPEAIDVEVRLVHDYEGLLYVQTKDEIDGLALWDKLPYSHIGSAESRAREVIEENHEAGKGEDAAAYLERIKAEGTESE